MCMCVGGYLVIYVVDERFMLVSLELKLTIYMFGKWIPVCVCLKMWCTYDYGNLMGNKIMNQWM